MNPGLRYIDDLKPIADTAYLRVRGVKGVAWAVSLYKGAAQAQLSNGHYQSVILLGIDDATLVGAPPELILGRIGDMQFPDSILVDEGGFNYMWPGEPLALGKTIEMNDHRAVIVGIFRASSTFSTQPIVYTRFGRATLAGTGTRATFAGL
jgi:putative ABC transport system permease protein